MSLTSISPPLSLSSKSSSSIRLHNTVPSCFTQSYQSAFPIRMYGENTSLTSISPPSLSLSSKRSSPIQLHNTVTELFHSISSICFFYQNVWGKWWLTSFHLFHSTVFKEVIINSASQHRNGLVSSNLINLRFPLESIQKITTYFVWIHSWSLETTNLSSHCQSCQIVIYNFTRNVAE